MKVDRAAFLALTMSIASLACAAGSDDGSSSSEGAATVGGQCNIHDPATESGPAAEGASSVLSFDPSTNFSAAEGLCSDRVFGAHPSNEAIADASKQSLYAKCNSYAKLYVPWTQRFAYQRIQRNSQSGNLSFAVLYAIDKQIVQNAQICGTPTAQTLCATQTTKDGCVALASQLKPEKQASLAMCMVKGFTAFTCSEGGLEGSLAAVSTGVGAGCLINPTTESVSGPAAEGANASLGFDPVNDFPAAESFCLERVFGSGPAAEGFSSPSAEAFATPTAEGLALSAKDSVAEKCFSYAKLYVPWTMRFAYQQIQKNSQPGTLSIDTLFAIDKQITTDATICSTPEARALCKGEKDNVACVVEASQLQPDAQSSLKSCLDDKGFDTYTCSEGSLR
jgi:hypothetical protein